MVTGGRGAGSTTQATAWHNRPQAHCARCFNKGFKQRSSMPLQLQHNAPLSHTKPLPLPSGCSTAWGPPTTGTRSVRSNTFATAGATRSYTSAMLASLHQLRAVGVKQCCRVRQGGGRRCCSRCRCLPGGECHGWGHCGCVLFQRHRPRRAAHQPGSQRQRVQQGCSLAA